MSQPRQRRIPNNQSDEPSSSVVKTPASQPAEDIMQDPTSLLSALRRQPVWIILAVSSGACAAFNGVFAKLTTTALTSTLSSHIATFLSLSPSNRIVEFLVRGTFFLLNLAFNAAMWALFTAALTRADSTTRVSIVNVSANFVVTAMLGWMVFGEKLSGLWFLGAGLLAVGNVVIGRREEGKKPGGSMGLDESVGEAELRGEEEAEGLLGRGGGRGRGRAEEVELDESEGGLLRRRSSEEAGRDRERVKRGVEVDDPI
ncbi:hypothetical protein LTR99_008991 [Exophiala xenobiotica]|uniref:EamA domain-containing protein n=1 Tax=Vermiconidia calcicola TaxID=1690605 RepID=A0AAV9PYR1_9PEZI|nr:hypothetical protein H2202_007941 [Exophiala xenobiotica]KAK5532259.1 hypothetical protein LTR25_007791 [Vermiconidia calcicola]KAK5533602.1 hypothetical protein LTR23_009173 [Chaetothyriales sp. CCFEE 6169]KAK5200195.1 hypothetical protein LTR92_000737 [Exophiala xenobiotica]KAK5204050.1 hypothetical protein LTR41_010261 [Exophiala xenobiotica]